MSAYLVDLIRRGDAALRSLEATWPDERWQTDIVGFCRDVLGVEPWQKQCEILQALQDHDRVTVTSGHKIGKSFLVSCAALWFYAAFPNSRVILMSATYRQVEWVLWREVRRMMRTAAVRLDGEIHKIAGSGLQAADGREVRGFTADRAEDAAGLSGAHMLFVFDEASGIDDRVWEAMTGNMAGGVKVILISNPTRNEGFFYESHSNDLWHRFRVSSEETPNVTAGKTVVPGLATRAWIQERRAEWGEESGIYRVRVRGEFALGEDARIITLAVLERATKAWADATADAPLFIGLDPAESRDDSVFVAVRGNKMLRSWVFKGLNPEAHVAHLGGILTELRRPREEPTIVVDREGAIGAAVYGALRVHAEANRYRLVGVRSSDKSRQPKIYARVRDDLWSGLATWLQRGGAIPSDARLEKELHCPDWIQSENGLMKATPKEKMRAILGHSPDIADALALAVWQPGRHEYAPETPERAPKPRPTTRERDRVPNRMDPYTGLDTWK